MVCDPLNHLVVPLSGIEKENPPFLFSDPHALGISNEDISPNEDAVLISDELYGISRK